MKVNQNQSDGGKDFEKSLREIANLSTEIGMKIGKDRGAESANLALQKMLAFSDCWIMFGLVRKTVEKVINKKIFSATEISEAIKALETTLSNANDMAGLQEIMKSLLKEL